MSFISLFIKKTRLCLSCRVTLVPIAVQFYVFFIFLLSNNRILHCFTILSHYIFAINEHKGKRHYIDELKKNHLFITLSTAGSTESYTILLSDPNTVSRNLQHIYLRLFKVTYRLLILQLLCHILLAFKTETHFIKG